MNRLKELLHTDDFINYLRFDKRVGNKYLVPEDVERLEDRIIPFVEEKNLFQSYKKLLKKFGTKTYTSQSGKVRINPNFESFVAILLVGTVADETRTLSDMLRDGVGYTSTDEYKKDVRKMRETNDAFEWALCQLDEDEKMDESRSLKMYKDIVLSCANEIYSLAQKLSKDE